MEKRVRFEAFDSLNDMLRDAVREKFGDGAWLSDFSASELIFRQEGRMSGPMVASTPDSYLRVGYSVADGKVTISDVAPTPVLRKTEYVNKTEAVLADAKTQLRESEKPE